MTNPREAYLLSRYEIASKKMKEAKPADSPSEYEYGAAYQELVKAGLAMQIKKKYRG